MSYKELKKLIELVGDKKIKDLKLEDIKRVKGVQR